MRLEELEQLKVALRKRAERGEATMRGSGANRGVECRPRPVACSAALLVVVLAALGCVGSRFSSFDQRTQVLCPGREGEVPFGVRGDVKMVVRVDDPRLAPPAGAHPDPREPDVVTVTVVAGDESRKVSFLAVATTWREPVAFYAQPPAEGVIVASGVKDPGWWGEDRFEISEVAAPAGRDLEVRHAGKVAQIAGGAVSSLFAGTPLGGGWEFRSPLTERERSSQDAPATSLRVQVTARCK